MSCGQSSKGLHERELWLYSQTDLKSAYMMTLELQFTIVDPL